MTFLSLITNLLTSSMKYLFLFWFMLYFLILFLTYIKNKNNKNFSKEKLKGSFVLFQLYLDQYFITNKTYTFIISFIYLFCIIFIFIILRYISLGQVNLILATENPTTSILPIIYIYIVAFITLILYKTLLDILFKKELNKLFLYFRHFSWYYTFHTKLNFKLGEYIFGCIRIPCYRIATLTYKEDMYPLPWHDSDLNYIHDDEAEYVIYNKIFIKLVYKAMNLARKYLIIKLAFASFAYILRFFHIHIHEFYKQAPYFILIIIFFIELYNKEFNYIYIVSFIVILIKTKRDFANFIKQRVIDFDEILSSYFYNNTIEYSIQHLYFLKNINLTTEKFIQSKLNYDLKQNYEKIIDYIFDNFKEKRGSDNKTPGIYRRFLTIVSFLGIAYYILINKQHYYIEIGTFINVPIIIIFIPLIIIIFSNYKTYYPVRYEEWYGMAEWKYSRTYNIIFWIATIIQGYIFWLLLLQPELVFIDNEVLIDKIIYIKKVYSIEDKIIYLFEYFEYYIKLIPLEQQKIEYLRHIIRQIDYKNLLHETTTLKDLIVYIKLLVDSYQLNDAFIEGLNNYYLTKELIVQNPWYIFLRNILFIGAVSSTLIYYKNLVVIAIILSKPGGVLEIANTLKPIFKNKLTLEEAISFINNFFK